MQIERLTEESPGFWEEMGPHFASRERAAELGGPIYSTPTTVWLVVRGAAWMAVEAGRPGVLTIDWAWVAPEHRGQGVYRALEMEALGLDPEATIRRATRHPWLATRWRKQGFTVRSQRGAWTYMERTP